MTIADELRKDRTLLGAIIGEVQANRVILDGLSDSYDVFRFTGGVVATIPLDLVAMNSYRQDPLAANRLSLTATERYRHVAGTIMDLGKEITAGARPRTLRCRYELADKFDQGAAEIRVLGTTLESALTKLVAEGKPSLALPETASVEAGPSTNTVLAQTTGGD